MSPEAERVYALVKQLSEAEQRELLGWMEADLLDEGDAEHGGFASEEIQKAWDAEIDRRMDDIEAGRGKSVPWEQVQKEIRGIIDGARKRRAD